MNNFVELKKNVEIVRVKINEKIENERIENEKSKIKTSQILYEPPALEPETAPDIKKRLENF